METRIRLGLVVSEFNSEITQPMLQKAREHSSSLGAEVGYICKVPGAFDMPLFIQLLLERKDVDAVVTLGAVIKGETQHDEVIAHQAAAKMSELALRYGKPVTLGVAGPGMTYQQGVDRVEEYSRRAVEAAVKLVRRSRKLRDATSSNISVEGSTGKNPLVVD